MANLELLAYFEAMQELRPRLPRCEVEALHRWEMSDDFTRTGDWPGWLKYLGPRPMPIPKQKLERAG